MRSVVAAALLLAGTSAAGAQSIADCRRIADNTARLACFDSLPDGGEALAPQVAPGPSLPAPSDPALASAQNAVRNGLRQPDSARFIGLQRRADAVCGFVNARDESGGYTGAKLFVYVAATGQSHILSRADDDPSGDAARAAYEAHCR